jgi:hypothetical protein
MYHDPDALLTMNNPPTSWLALKGFYDKGVIILGC